MPSWETKVTRGRDGRSSLLGPSFQFVQRPLSVTFRRDRGPHGPHGPHGRTLASILVLWLKVRDAYTSEYDFLYVYIIK